MKMILTSSLIFCLALSSAVSHSTDNSQRCERAKHHLQKQKLIKRQKERNGYTISEMRKIKDRIERLQLDIDYYCG
ncbi:hypothetical protein [Hahella ganghwensis]|uniref:hypothetical protein n=1 Tax=Hahella ganghwensis TaxID=286420 RepID=UPI000360BDE1|nr:hypothetical protein [Hahella ganghwensis]